MELYIHIPFCVKKCDYCDFLSFAADEQTQKSYVAALQKELAFYGAKYKDRRITTIFIGGGTPSWLKEDYMQAIMETVYHYFSVEQDAEITIECNPGTITEHKFEVYRRIGINRLSIGLQSVHKWIYGRNIFASIDRIVDELFENYLSRPNVRQPILKIGRAHV